MPGVVVYTCNSNPGEVGPGRSQGSLASQHICIDEVQVSERDCLKKKTSWMASEGVHIHMHKKNPIDQTTEEQKDNYENQLFVLKKT